MILSPYGDRFRSMRKLVARHIGTNVGISKFRPVQELEARYFLARVCEHPENFLKDIRLYAPKEIQQLLELTLSPTDPLHPFS
jgi:hypothetical protein